jgi:protein translocase, SecG subunit
MTALYIISIAIFLLVCFILCSVILMQESKSSGLGASFGGDPTSSVFGTSTADVLKKFTGWMAALFLTLSLVMSLWTALLSHNEVANSIPKEEIESSL